MGERIHVLAQQLFGKPSLAECNLADIRNLVQRYPYFAPAQFLLLQKLKEENSPDYGSQLQKAVLYYHNPLEFQYFISSDAFYTEVSEQAVNESSPAPAPEPSEPPVKQMETNTVASHPELDGELLEQIAENSGTENHSSEPLTEEIKTPETADRKEPAFPSLKPAVGETDETLTFEPFHTVDYFASQGIKLAPEEQPKDQFGKQLKSFTEWLKTMKRLPAQSKAAQLDVGTEQKVVHLAEDSVHEADVVTEAMAEVWLKQGNRPKALEVYNKLSLLNPSKRAYFAAKIDNLKSS